jgi:hypothetical protein
MAHNKAAVKSCGVCLLQGAESSPDARDAVHHWWRGAHNTNATAAAALAVSCRTEQQRVPHRQGPHVGADTRAGHLRNDQRRGR